MIERHLRREEPELARAMDAFAGSIERDPVPRTVALALLVIASLLFLGWTSTADEGLLAGAVLVAACTPVAWLVGLARRPVPGT